MRNIECNVENLCILDVMFNCRIELLRRWRGREGSRATYENLVRALLQVDDKEDAHFVVDLLAGTVCLVCFNASN